MKNVFYFFVLFTLISCEKMVNTIGDNEDSNIVKSNLAEFQMFPKVDSSLLYFKSEDLRAELVKDYGMSLEEITSKDEFDLIISKLIPEDLDLNNGLNLNRNAPRDSILCAACVQSYDNTNPLSSNPPPPNENFTFGWICDEEWGDYDDRLYASVDIMHTEEFQLLYPALVMEAYSIIFQWDDFGVKAPIKYRESDHRYGNYCSRERDEEIKASAFTIWRNGYKRLYANVKCDD